MNKIKKIIYIVGVGRSGTTLLQNILNSHPQIAFIPEINYARRFLLNKELGRIYDNNQERLINLISSDKWLKRLDKKITNKLKFENVEISNFGIELYKQLLLINCELNNKIIAGDKDPRSIEYVEKISNALPNIHWIHIIRDPRDVLLSKKNADWSKNGSNLKHIFAGYVQLLLAKKWSKLFPNKFTELYYEDLLLYPEQTLKELCKLLNIEYNSSILEFKNSAQELIADDEFAWKKEVFSPINKDNINKWENILSIKLVAFVENLITPAFSNYNYTKSNPNIKLPSKIKIWILKPIFLILSKIYIFIKIKL